MVGEHFQVSFTFSGDDINNLSGFQPPGFQGFSVLSGPNSSTSMQIINGAVSASLTYSYYLRPNAEGKFTIQPARITFKNNPLKTQTITIEVVKQSGNNQQNQGNNQQQDITAQIAENLFIKAYVDKQNVFQGEQVTVTYKLYTALNIATPSITKLPSYKGFWAEELEMSNNIFFETEVLNGRRFNSAVLKKAALFPSQSGKLSVTPFELSVPVQIRRQRGRNNVFDEFFNDPFFSRPETIEYEAKSNTVRINVKSLPKTDSPSFTGAVGDYAMDVSIDKQNVVVNEPITLKVTLSGKGNLKLVQLPELKVPTGFEVYDPKVNENIQRGHTINGNKSFEYLLVPRRPGQKVLPPIEFTYFDPKQEKYITRSSKPYTITIGKGEGTNTEGDLSKRDVVTLDTDIRFLKTDAGSLSKKGEYLVETPLFYVISAFPLLGLIGLVLWRNQQEKLSSDVQLLKLRRAQKMAKTRLKTAKKLLLAGNDKEFYDEISAATIGYLEDKLVLPTAEFTLDAALLALEKEGADDELRERVKNVIEKCEFIRFAPNANGQEEMENMYTESADVIVNLESQLTSAKRSKV